MIKLLIFSIVKTKLNITFATSIISCYIKNSSYQHKKAIKTILKYIKSSKYSKITYNSQKILFVEGYSNLN